jgi:hypothetical protein
MSTTPVIVDCARIPDADMRTIDRLARAQLAARRAGFEMRLRDASRALLELIWLAGLDGVLRVEVRRQPEKREQPGGVEEERELPDLPV